MFRTSKSICLPHAHLKDCFLFATCSPLRLFCVSWPSHWRIPWSCGVGVHVYINGVSEITTVNERWWLCCPIAYWPGTKVSQGHPDVVATDNPLCLQLLWNTCTDVACVFTPQPLRAVGVLFSPMVSGWAGRRWEEVCPACISETVRCRKLIFGRDIG